MDDGERDELLRGIASDMAEVKATLSEHGTKLDSLTETVDVIRGTVNAMSNQIQDVARAVRELGGDVDVPPEEATG